MPPFLNLPSTLFSQGIEPVLISKHEDKLNLRQKKRDLTGWDAFIGLERVDIGLAILLVTTQSRHKIIRNADKFNPVRL